MTLDQRTLILGLVYAHGALKYEEGMADARDDTGKGDVAHAAADIVLDILERDHL